MSKIQFHLQTLVELQNVLPNKFLQNEFKRITDTVVYTAPEILDKKVWTGIYNLCVTNFTDKDNPIHSKCFEIYTQRYNKFKELYNT
jgi:hypothetical protein